MISADVVIGIAAAFFIVGGLFQLIASCAIVQPGWGWQTKDGIIAVILAMLRVLRICAGERAGAKNCARSNRKPPDPQPKLRRA